MSTQEEWENSVKTEMESLGWTCDRDDETKLGFYKDDENGDRWIRDYVKETRTFIQFNGNQKINLVVRKNER